MKGSPDDLSDHRVIRKQSEIRIFSETSVCANEARDTENADKFPFENLFQNPF